MTIGAPGIAQIVGYVRSVELLYTSIKTLSNDVVKIPNHTLFSEKIYNSKESDGAIFELEFSFDPERNPNLCSKTALDHFFHEIQTFAIAENKMKWSKISWACIQYDSRFKVSQYKMWITHNNSLQEFTVPFMARTELLQKIKELQEAIESRPPGGKK